MVTIILKSITHANQYSFKGDIKPANFLYDRKKKLFKLVDFGLAQRTGESDESKEPKARHPQCKRKLTSSDLANSMESPPPNAPSDKRRKMIHPSSERGSNRKVLAERYTTFIRQFYEMTEPSLGFIFHWC